MNFYEVEFLAKERGRRIEREIRDIRLMQSLQAGKLSWRKKCVLRLADLLIDVGLHLKSHYRANCRKQTSSLWA